MQHSHLLFLAASMLFMYTCMAGMQMHPGQGVKRMLAIRLLAGWAFYEVYITSLEIWAFIGMCMCGRMHSFIHLRLNPQSASSNSEYSPQ